MNQRLAMALMLLFLSLGCHQQSLDVADQVDLARFQGSWFEIAKLPRPTQADCVGTTASYQLQSDGRLLVKNQCRLGNANGALRTVTAFAHAPDRAVPAKLSVDFGGFYGDFWIIDLDPDYRYAVVGHPTREYLWLLSRGPTLDAATLTAILERATQKGFDVSRLEYTTQFP